MRGCVWNEDCVEWIQLGDCDRSALIVSAPLSTSHYGYEVENVDYFSGEQTKEIIDCEGHNHSIKIVLTRSRTKKSQDSDLHYEKTHPWGLTAKISFNFAAFIPNN